LDIKVIVGNPPYSSGQDSANDNNQNIKYPKLDKRIEGTYAAYSKATNKNSLYDSYIRAIRWASDRIGKAGVIGFVTNAGYIESSSADGLRKCLAEEFSNIYIFHLRGNQRTSGERSRKEGGKIFGSGSRAPIAISILVKNSAAKQYGQIFFHDIGDYLTTEQKLEKIAEVTSIAGLKDQWQVITPDVHNDWLNQRDDSFDNFISIGNKKDKTSINIFNNYSRGLETGRDAWVYNSSKVKLQENIRATIKFYNSELQKFKKETMGLDRHERVTSVSDIVSNDPQKISWSSSLVDAISRYQTLEYHSEANIRSQYRPFINQWLYYDGVLNHRVGQMPHIFPDAQAENIVICVSGIGAKSGFSSLVSNRITCSVVYFPV